MVSGNRTESRTRDGTVLRGYWDWAFLFRTSTGKSRIGASSFSFSSPILRLADSRNLSSLAVCRKSGEKGSTPLSCDETKEKVKKSESRAKAGGSPSNAEGRKENGMRRAGGSHPWRYCPNGAKRQKGRIENATGIRKSPLDHTSLHHGGWRKVPRIKNFRNVDDFSS
jgi:hypothetical protein